MGSKYTLSTELLLDRFGPSNKFRKKSKEKFRDIQQMTPHRPYDVFSRSSWVRPENVLGISQINLPRMPLRRYIRMFPERHFETSPERQIGTYLGQIGQIVPLSFVLGTLEGDVLGTNICRLDRTRRYLI